VTGLPGVPELPPLTLAEELAQPLRHQPMDQAHMSAIVDRLSGDNPTERERIATVYIKAYRRAMETAAIVIEREADAIIDGHVR
jgi:hypothetical protein